MSNEKRYVVNSGSSYKYLQKVQVVVVRTEGEYSVVRVVANNGFTKVFKDPDYKATAKIQIKRNSLIGFEFKIISHSLGEILI